MPPKTTTNVITVMRIRFVMCRPLEKRVVLGLNSIEQQYDKRCARSQKFTRSFSTTKGRFNICVCKFPTYSPSKPKKNN